MQGRCEGFTLPVQATRTASTRTGARLDDTKQPRRGRPGAGVVRGRLAAGRGLAATDKLRRPGARVSGDRGPARKAPAAHVDGPGRLRQDAAGAGGQGPGRRVLRGRRALDVVGFSLGPRPCPRGGRQVPRPARSERPEDTEAALRLAGTLALLHCEHPRAEGRLREALALCRELGDRWRVASALENLAETAQASGLPERAARLFGAVEALRGRLRAPVPRRSGLTATTVSARRAPIWAGGGSRGRSPPGVLRA